MKNIGIKCMKIQIVKKLLISQIKVDALLVMNEVL